MNYIGRAFTTPPPPRSPFILEPEHQQPGCVVNATQYIADRLGRRMSLWNECQEYCLYSVICVYVQLILTVESVSLHINFVNSESALRPKELSGGRYELSDNERVLIKI
jgi:hypothetical protein